MANNKSLNKKTTKVKSSNVEQNNNRVDNVPPIDTKNNESVKKPEHNNPKQDEIHVQVEKVDVQNTQSDILEKDVNVEKEQHINKDKIEVTPNDNTSATKTEESDVIESNNDQSKNESIDYQKLYERSQFEFEKLKVLYGNVQSECNKLHVTLELERKQLIDKLEEKSKAAQIQIDQKVTYLESAKQDEIVKIKESLASDIINAFIDPILLFESSIQNAPKDNPSIIAYLQGYTMIVNMFKEKLDSLGVQQIDVHVGDKFNEKFMSAFDVEHVPGIEPNKVVKIVTKGFVLNKKIIKYVSVVVSK